MANSPDSPENGTTPALQTLAEEDESMPDVSPTPTIGLGPPPQKRKAPPMPSLAAELGLEDSDEDDTPLQDMLPQRIGNSRPKEKAIPEQRRFTAREKGKGRAEPSAAVVTRTRSGAIEKENKAKRLKTSSNSGSNAVPSHRSTSAARLPSGGPVKKSSKLTSKGASTVGGSGVAGVQTRAASKVKGGARRVPINSAEAALVPRVWKG